MADKTTASMDKLTCSDYVDFENLKTYFDSFIGPTTTQTTRIWNSRLSRKLTTKSFD